MEDGNHEGCDDTDELLCTDVGVCPPVLRDHCDLLLDAIDAQLRCLQTHSQGGNGKPEDALSSVHSLDKSTSASKDTGLGTDKVSSTTPDGSNTDHTVEPDRRRMEISGLQNEEREEAGLGCGSSRREQCLWRLERLLGTNTGIAEKEEVEEEDSVCTEDFSSRFLDVMLEPPKLNADSASISSDTPLRTEPRGLHTPNLCGPPLKSPIKHLAGVPLRSFDSVAIDSDLESVCTERVRLHLQGTLNNRAAAQRGLMKNDSSALSPCLKNAQRPEKQALSSDDDAESVRRYRALRAPASVQRRERKNQNKMNHSLNSFPPNSCVSVLEREELNRLLYSAKSELFSEQRKFRHTLDSMQEKLEEVNQELEQAHEEGTRLRQKCSRLEEELARSSKKRHELFESVQRERVELQGRVEALEKIVAQKELLLLAQQEDKSVLQSEIRAVREEQSAKLAHAQNQKDEDVARLRTRMALTHAEELQRVQREAHEEKEAALRKQALIQSEALQKHIQVKEQEVTRLQESLEKQKQEEKRREEERRGETQEQVRRAVERERRKWEELRAESLREQRGKLERQMQEVEREKRNVVALHKGAESEAERLRECVKRSEQELQGLKKELAECERVQQVAAARHERQNASWAQDIHTECVFLHELLTRNGVAPDNGHFSDSATVSEAVQVLKSFRKPLQQFITGLQSHVTSLTHSNQQISTDKERELRLQREQLTAEKDEALNALKEKLIQEHIEELSSLSRMRLREDDGGGTAASLRRQLRDKDEELRQVQRSMARWKEKTTAWLAGKFERELTSELEKWKVDWLRKRKTSRSTSEQQKRLELLEGEMRHLTGSSSDSPDGHLVSAHVSDLPPTPSTHDLSSYKLLRHLQSRIRQLQADTHNHTPSAARPKQGRGDSELAGSYLETIAPGLENGATRRRSAVKPAPS